MSKKKTLDIFALIIAALSLVISSVAIYVPYNQSKSALKEDVSLELNPRFSGGVVKTTEYNLNIGRVVQIPWELLISNTCQRRISIIDYELQIINPKGIRMFSGIDGGFYDSNFKPMSLPITLEAGDSIPGVVYVGVIVPQNVFDILNKIDKPIYTKTARITLANSGIDIYGNKVNYNSYGGKSYLLTVDKDEQNSPTYLLIIKTSRRNEFIATASTYGQ